MGATVLITGGSRSGKSSHALDLATNEALVGGGLFFLATAEPLDEEMRARIERHRASRPNHFETIEEPLKVAEAIAALDGRARTVVLDCLTLWISNLVGAPFNDDEVLRRVDQLAETLARASFSSFIVTDEVGWGVVPEHPLGRRFRDLLGWANQRIGKIADQVILMVAGCPVRVK